MQKKEGGSPAPARPYRRDSDMAPGFSMAKILLSNALPQVVYDPVGPAKDQTS